MEPLLVVGATGMQKSLCPGKGGTGSGEILPGMLSRYYRGGSIVSTLYEGFGGSRISRKVIADNGCSIGGIDIDTIMISGPQETACIADENIFLYGAIGRIE